MHLLSIAVGEGTPVVWALLFKTKDAADAAFGFVRDLNHDAKIAIVDDFGQALLATGSTIKAAFMEDMDESKLAQMERSMHEMRLRAALQARAQADPVLRAGLGGGGPAVLSPMGQRFS
jgi:hypothetical protein